MAKRRMFSLDIVDTDSFLELPLTTQALYFHLGMRADDDGFVSSPKRLLAMVGCSADDMRLLSAKGYVIPFSSGICVIRDWRVNNHIQKDRYHETLYISEKSALRQNGTGAYLLTDTTCIQDGYILDTEVRLGNIQLMERLVNDRVLSGCPLCVTTNIPRAAMINENRQGLARIYDRVVELCCMPVLLTSGNRREANANERRTACVKILGV